MKYEFTNDYLTGIEAIDQEHAHLFELANQTYDLLHDELVADKYDKIVDLINELREYTKTHFAHEEEYMAQIGFQHIWSEKRAHKMFVARLESVDLKKVDENQDQYIDDLLDFLAKWLTAHIKFADKRIADPAKAANPPQ